MTTGEANRRLLMSGGAVQAAGQTHRTAPHLAQHLAQHGAQHGAQHNSLCFETNDGLALVGSRSRYCHRQYRITTTVQFYHDVEK